jgi:hypothetical protein
MKFSVHFLDIQHWWTYSEQIYTVTFIEISVRFENIHITYIGIGTKYILIV